LSGILAGSWAYSFFSWSWGLLPSNSLY